MAQLNQKQSEELDKLKISNSLVNSICFHLEEISAKKIKKKSKRNQQKLNKKFGRENSMTCGPMGTEELLYFFENMRIRDDERMNCCFDEERFLKNKK